MQLAIKATCAETIQCSLLHELSPFRCDPNPGKTCSTPSRSCANSWRHGRHARLNQVQARHPVPCVPRLLRKTTVDVRLCHACHVKRRWMSGSATPATQKWRGAPATNPGPRAPPSTISATPATQNDGRCEVVPRLPREIKVDVTKCHACHAEVTRRGVRACVRVCVCCCVLLLCVCVCVCWCVVVCCCVLLWLLWLLWLLLLCCCCVVVLLCVACVVVCCGVLLCVVVCCCVLLCVVVCCCVCCGVLWCVVVRCCVVCCVLRVVVVVAVVAVVVVAGVISAAFFSVP